MILRVEKKREGYMVGELDEEKGDFG